MTRRESLRALISGGAAYKERPERKNRRSHHRDEVIYHGPITIPDEVIALLGTSTVYRTTCRHPALRVHHNSITYVLRTALSGTDYVGEVVRTQAGAYRVHAWTVSLRGGKPLGAIIPREEPPCDMPPVSAPLPDPDPSPYDYYFTDPQPHDENPRVVGVEEAARLLRLQPLEPDELRVYTLEALQD